MQYRREIDGLRALAVLPVVFFHAGFAWASGGFVGVDIFFVISGFLITSIIIEELDRDRFSMVQFYERRARRILPALVLVMLACLPAAWLFMNEYALGRFAEGLLGVALFSSNIVFWLQDGYFEEASEFNPIIHTWSLAVEEQFYIFFPLLLLLLVKGLRMTRPRVTTVVLTLTLLSLALSIYQIDIADNASVSSAGFFLLPARVWELGVGVLCALWLKPSGGQALKRAGSGWLSALGLALIFVPVALYDKTTAFPGLASVPPVVGTGLLICFCHPRDAVGRVLQRPILVGIGLVSYSLYLWHQPLLAYYRIVANDIHIPTTVAVALIAASGALALVSWHYVEKPFRNKTAISRAGLFRISAASIVGLSALGAASLGVSTGLEQRLAGTLEQAEYVYFGNVDERRFIQARLDGPLDPSGTVVVGSSRLMSLSSEVLGNPLLNVSVSGASLEDYVAFAPAAAAATGATRVIIGADPWILNQHTEGEARWRSVEPWYLHWKGVIQSDRVGAVPPPPGQDDDRRWRMGLLSELYAAVNRNTLATDDGTPGAQAKRAKDGQHVYALDYVQMGEERRQATLAPSARYKMQKYVHSSDRQRLFEQLLTHLASRGLEVALVLPPYHPASYAVVVEKQLGHPDAETRFRELAGRMNIPILGSYDGAATGCAADEFYDGMHPRPSCLARVLETRQDR